MSHDQFRAALAVDVLLSVIALLILTAVFG